MKEFLRSFAWLFALGIVLVCSACNTSRDEKRSSQQGEKVKKLTDADEVVAILNAMPDWTSIVEHPENRAKIEESCAAIRGHYSLPVIREALLRILNGKELMNDIDMASKVFVLNRYLFRVPDNVDEDKAQFFGGWVGLPHQGDNIDMRWPWIAGADGKLELKGDFGGYMGPPYDAVQEFDYFNKLYGAR